MLPKAAANSVQGHITSLMGEGWLMGRVKIQAATGEYDDFLTPMRKRKLRWFGCVYRSFALGWTIL